MSYHATTHPWLRGWSIVDADGSTVDVVRSAAAAAYGVDLLNAGVAHINHHGCLGCRVILDLPPTVPRVAHRAERSAA